MQVGRQGGGQFGGVSFELQQGPCQERKETFLEKSWLFYGQQLFTQ